MVSVKIWPVTTSLLDCDIKFSVGKIKAKINVPPDIAKDELEAAAKEAISEHLEGKSIRKAIVVPGRLVNFVV